MLSSKKQIVDRNKTLSRQNSLPYLNLGCGYRFNDRWTNVNFTQTGKNVLAWNLCKGIPFPNNSFDVVYHSHILEHFTQDEAKFFLQECFRVLKPNGVIRVVVPDLEQITKTYLIALEKAASGDSEWALNYQWIVLEMLDQLVRNYPGGKMKKYLAQPQIDNYDFVVQRFGREVKQFIGQLNANNKTSPSKIKQIYHSSIVLKEKILERLFGKYYRAFKIGNFRQNGEIHQWMYDRYSLSLILGECGFKKMVKCAANESRIANWNSFCLDIEPNGEVYKPDSLYMEAIKTL